MTSRQKKTKETVAEYYDRVGALDEIVDEPVEFALEEELREAILKGKRKRRLKNLSIKLDAAQILAVRKIATMQSIPYQTLIRKWLADMIRKELRLTA
ncbi:MAG: hypothetical protein AABY65_14145 [Nitrospirota bacterium]|jgi:predicted DNA binding CopG/RHH family protein